MSKELVVHTWDDLASASGTKSEATHSDVPISFGGQSVEIDLNDGNYERLAKFLAPFMEHGRRIKAATKRGPDREPRKVSPETIEFRKGLRKWADAEGRTTEYRFDKKGGGYNYKYPVGLIRDYKAFLERHAA